MDNSADLIPFTDIFNLVKITLPPAGGVFNQFSDASSEAAGQQGAEDKRPQ